MIFNTKKVTAQEVFDQVATHLLTQKKRSIKPKNFTGEKFGNGCAYRGKNGLKCAIGALISDREFSFLTEDVGGDDIQSILGRFSQLPDLFLNNLQNIHDSHKPSRWIEKLSAFATNNKLDKSVLKQFRKPKAVKCVTNVT